MDLANGCPQVPKKNKKKIADSPERDHYPLNTRIKTMEISVAIIEKAKEIFNQHLQDFPEDEWIGLDPEWDLNLWLEEEKTPRATIYPVVNGETDTQTYTAIANT